MNLGLMKDEVKSVPYDEKWKFKCAFQSAKEPLTLVR